MHGSGRTLLYLCKDRAFGGEKTGVICAEWPVDQDGLTDDILARHAAPVPRVRTVGAIITQHEIGVGRNEHVGE